jgi:hypothetical protein
MIDEWSIAESLSVE